MKKKPFITWSLLLVLIISKTAGFGQNHSNGNLRGSIQIDSTWSSSIYLSYIPTFSDIHSMSSEMIIADAPIDSLGYFEFDLDLLPVEPKIYRLHISKKGDTKTSLIIGGSNENYLAFIASRDSQIKLRNSVSKPPFKHSIFETSFENSAFQQITNLVYEKDSIASKSGRAKRKFIEDRLTEKLLDIADSSSNALVSLYALHMSDFESNYTLNKSFYRSYLKKWSHADDPYSKDFRSKLPLKQPENNWPSIIVGGILLTLVGFIIGKNNLFKNNRIKTLTVQERKVFNLLKEGATNKEIAEEFNIGISTVKSHVSSILGKLNVKSRKELMD